MDVHRTDPLVRHCHRLHRNNPVVHRNQNHKAIQIDRCAHHCHRLHQMTVYRGRQYLHRLLRHYHDQRGFDLQDNQGQLRVQSKGELW